MVRQKSITNPILHHILARKSDAMNESKPPVTIALPLLSTEYVDKPSLNMWVLVYLSKRSQHRIQ